MKYIYAALLLHSAGKELNEENLGKVVESIGEKPDKAQIKSIATALSEIDVDEVLKSALATPTVATPAPAEAAPEAKEEEKPKEEEKAEEEAFEGLGGLFG